MMGRVCVLALRWRDKRYCTGIEALDLHNRLLFNHLNQLLRATEPEARDEEFEGMLDFLDAYAENQFPFEEAIMTARRCSVRELNREDHAWFLAELGAVHHRYACEGWTAPLREEVMALVVHWLESHVAGVDTRLGVY